MPAPHLEWYAGPPPARDDGRVVLVVLKPEAAMDAPAEHCGGPVAVRCWAGKLKTTAHPTRLSYDDVLRWAEVG